MLRIGSGNVEVILHSPFIMWNNWRKSIFRAGDSNLLLGY